MNGVVLVASIAFNDSENIIECFFAIFSFPWALLMNTWSDTVGVSCESKRTLGDREELRRQMSLLRAATTTRIDEKVRSVVLWRESHQSTSGWLHKAKGRRRSIENFTFYAKVFMIFSNITFSLQWGKHRSLVHFLSGSDSGLLCANDRSSICCSRRYPMLLHQQFPLYTKPIQGTFSEGTKEANKVHDTKYHNSSRTIEFLGPTVLKFWNSGISIQRDGHQGGDCDACL